MGIFDSNYYYRLSSDNFAANHSLSTGNTTTVPHDVRMSNTSLFASDNWQLFFQDGVYFLRNFDYNNTYHLGIDVRNPDRSTPVMLLATVEIGQQWIIAPSDISNTTFRLTNKLLVYEHNINSFMGNAVDDKYSVHMHAAGPTQSGINWIITQNPSRIVVLPEMSIPYPALQQSPSASQTTAGATPSNTASGDDIFFKPGQLTPITIAGIVIGIVVFLGSLSIFILFWLRHKRLGPGGIRGVPGPTPPPRHGRAELVKEPLPAENSRDSQLSQASTLNSGLSRHQGGNRTKPKQSDEVSIELPEYSKPSVQERSFV